MISNSDFRSLALSFPGVVEQPHFDRAAFKIMNKRIFATLHEPTSTANIKLTPEDQAIFVQYAPEAIYPVPNKFGLQGWTTFELRQLEEAIVSEALLAAHKEVLVKKPGKK